MGIAQVRPERAPWRLAYLGGLAVVILYQLDLDDLLLQALH